MATDSGSWDAGFGRVHEAGEELFGRVEVGETEVWQNGEGKGEVTRVRLVRGPDLDGAEVWVPSFLNYSVGQGREEDGAVGGELDGGQKERLRYCLDTLKLPALLAAHLALGQTKHKMEDFVKPEDGMEPSILLGMVGEPNKGKSVRTAMLALRLEVPVLDFESRSGAGVTRYLERLKGLGREITYVDAVEELREMREKEGSSPKGEVRTFREMLDTGLDFFKDKKDRPAVVLVDMPGEPVEFQGQKGGVTGYSREHTVYELAGRQSFEGGSIYTTRRLPADYMEGRVLAWMTELVTNGENIARSRTKRNVLARFARQR